MCRKVLILSVMAVFLISWMLPVLVSAEDKTGDSNTQVTGDSQSQNVSGTGSPDIFFPETRHDFGNVAQSTTLVHVFKVMNQGDAPLKILKVKAS